MSSWGATHFEDDDALDYVDTLVAQIVKEVDRAARKRRLGGDEVLARCIPRLAVLAILLKGSGSVLPEDADLPHWQDVFLTAFDKDATWMFNQSADARRRRRAIEQLFRQLLAFGVS